MTAKVRIDVADMVAKGRQAANERAGPTTRRPERTPTMTSLDDIAALADEVTNPHQHTERVPYWDASRHRKFREHRTVQPGLLAQLAELGDAQPIEAEGGRSIPDSRPPCNLDAVSQHFQIQLAATRWCVSLGLEVRDTPEGNIRALVGAAGALDDDTRTALADEMRSWRNAAATLTGWRTPPYRPQVPCPLVDCGKVGKLRINLTRQTAACLACGALWDTEAIGILADYVRGVTAT